MVRHIYSLCTPSSSLLTAHCLLPTAYCLLPTAYCILPTAYCLLPTAYHLLPSYCLLPIAYCLLLTSPPPRIDLEDISDLEGYLLRRVLTTYYLIYLLFAAYFTTIYLVYYDVPTLLVSAYHVQISKTSQTWRGTSKAHTTSSSSAQEDTSNPKTVCVRSDRAPQNANP